MLIGASVGHIVSLLMAVISFVSGGLIVSASAYVGHTIQQGLSRNTSIDRPDPTNWKRIWQRFFERYFHQFGKEVTQSVDRSDAVKGALYQATVGSAGMAVAISAFIILSWVLLGGVVASYYISGFAPDVTPVIESLAGAAVVFGLAVTFMASEQPDEAV